MARIRRETAEPGFLVVEVPLERSREFVTIGPDAEAWSVPEAAQDLAESFSYAGQVFDGSFVRLEPPPDASDETVEWVRGVCVNGGAIRVFVVPRRRVAEVLEPKGEIAAGARPRDVVLQLVEESPLQEKDALRDLCEEIMARRSL